MLAVILITSLYYPENAALERYDFLFLFALGVQILLLATGLESWDEAKVIAMFHIVGTVMEVFKTHMGSWTYPGDAFFRIEDVPLFSGFMYSAIGSYLARVWRIFDFRYTDYPAFWPTVFLSVASYLNFFTHHYIYDFRYVLICATILYYGRCRVHFRAKEMRLKMPLAFGFLLVALFIWFAENIATLGQAWIYPSQVEGWSMVSWSKITSWYLLLILSFVMVTFIQKPLPEKT